MELEQRVKTLEYEMKILKNEVQRTLLDIQEQVLIHYYPTLRAEESKHSEGSNQTAETLRTRQVGQPATSSPPATPATPATPVIKKVSLEEIREAQNDLATESAPTDHAVGNKPGEWSKKPNLGSNGNDSVNGGATMATERGSAKLMEWLTSSATKIGDERDGQQVNDVLDDLTKLNALVDRAGSIEEALRLIGEEKVG